MLSIVSNTLGYTRSMNQIYCSNCGTLTNANANFCQQCGAALHGPDAAKFRAQDPAVDPATAQRLITTDTKIEYFPRQNLGSDAILYFILSNIQKTFIIAALIIVGLFVMTQVFAFVALLYIASIVISAYLIYNNFLFEINEDGLFIESGIIHKGQVSLPFDQVQNVNIERTILDRMLGLAKISIETAGSAVGNVSNGSNVVRSRAEAYLPGLQLSKAKQIHDLLIDAADGSVED